MLKWPRRILLFVLINLLVVFTLNLLMNLLGVRPYLTARGIDYQSLLIFCVIWGFGGAFISLALSKVMVKWMMKVQIVNPDSPGGASERWLVDTVHRLARNAGLNTMPEVGIYESPEPNAFATGPTRDHALVCVSSGLYSHMEKDEIEGVLGHEITHVANGDMVTMALMQGVLNAFVLFLSKIIAFAISQAGRSENEERGGYSFGTYMIEMALQMGLGILSMIPLMAFSRWREFRADAGGAKLAGRAKMIGALQALEGLQDLKTRGVVNEPAAITALKISAGKGGSLFASHPPMEERIKRLREATLPSSVFE